MDSRIVFAVAMVLVYIALLFRWEIMPAGNEGAGYRLDRWTGNLVFLAGPNTRHLNIKDAAKAD